MLELDKIHWVNCLYSSLFVSFNLWKKRRWKHVMWCDLMWSDVMWCDVLHLTWQAVIKQSFPRFDMAYQTRLVPRNKENKKKKHLSTLRWINIIYHFVRNYKHFWRVVLSLAVLEKPTWNFKLGFHRDTFQEGQDNILVLLVFIQILCFSLQASY